MDYVQSLQYDGGYVVLIKLIKLTKPGIIFGNIITFCGGFFITKSLDFSLLHFVNAISGVGLIIACGCILNNYFDRDIDQLMKRTQNRLDHHGNPLSLSFSITYSSIFALIGLILLYQSSNFITVIVILFGLFFYVVLYTMWTKRTSILGTMVGAVSGSTPIVAGYTAATNQLDMIALILFIILFCWQIPHFFSISIYHKDDYIATKIPAFPLKFSTGYTKINMSTFILLYLISAMILGIIAELGFLYGITEFVLGLVWLILCCKKVTVENERHWAHRMFTFSIINITIFSLLLLV